MLRSLGWTQALREQVRSLEQRCIAAKALASQLQQRLPQMSVQRKALAAEAVAQATLGDQHAGAGESRRDTTGGGAQHDSAGVAEHRAGFSYRPQGTKRLYAGSRTACAPQDCSELTVVKSFYICLMH